MITNTFILEGYKQNNKWLEKPWCDYCKRAWHTKETCWKIHGKP